MGPSLIYLLNPFLQSCFLHILARLRRDRVAFIHKVLGKNWITVPVGPAKKMLDLHWSYLDLTGVISDPAGLSSLLVDLGVSDYPLHSVKMSVLILEYMFT